MDLAELERRITRIEVVSDRVQPDRGVVPNLRRHPARHQTAPRSEPIGTPPGWGRFENFPKGTPSAVLCVPL